MPSAKLNSKSATSAFRGKAVRTRLLTALQSQFVVGNDQRIARLLLQKADVKKVASNTLIMEQGCEDTHLAMILGGRVEVIVNGRIVASRKAGEHVGEMSLLDSYARRSATVRTTEETTLAIISEYDFTKAAEKFPSLWRRLALALGDRLREREKFHAPPRERPSVFIASSSEALPLAEYIYKTLRRSNAVPHIWSRGVFEAGKTTIEDLVRQTGESDFAIILASLDDITKSRSKISPSPRDNVIFELGLFMGALSRERTLVLVPKGTDLKIPSDLLGMTHISYTNDPNKNIAKSMKAPMKTVRSHIKKYGPR